MLCENNSSASVHVCMCFVWSILSNGQCSFDPFLWNWSQSGCVISVKLVSVCLIRMKLDSVWLCLLHETSLSTQLCDCCETIWHWLHDSHKTGLTLVVWFPWNWFHSVVWFLCNRPHFGYECDPCETGLTLVVWFVWNWSHFRCVIPVKLASVWVGDFFKTGPSLVVWSL